MRQDASHHTDCVIRPKTARRAISALLSLNLSGIFWIGSLPAADDFAEIPVQATSGLTGSNGATSSRRTANQSIPKRSRNSSDARLAQKPSDPKSPSDRTPSGPTDNIRISQDNSSSRRAQSNSGVSDEKIAGKPLTGATTEPSTKPNTWVLKIDAPKSADVETNFEPSNPTPAKRQAASEPTIAMRAPGLLPTDTSAKPKQNSTDLGDKPASGGRAKSPDQPATDDSLIRLTVRDVGSSRSDEAERTSASRQESEGTNIRLLDKNDSSTETTRPGRILLQDRAEPGPVAENKVTEDRVSKRSSGRQAKSAYTEVSPASGVFIPLTHNYRGRLIRRELHPSASKAVDRETLEILLGLSKLEKLGDKQHSGTVEDAGSESGESTK